MFPVGTTMEEAHDYVVGKAKDYGEALGVDHGELGQYFQEAMRIADQIRKPREAVWDQCWNLYNGVYDWSGKAQWQSKNNIPKVRGIVDKATSTFRRALVRMKRFYSIESETKLGIEKGLYTMSLLDYWFDQLKFVTQFTEGLKNGLITSTIIFKVWWDWKMDFEPRWEDTFIEEDVLELGIKVGTRKLPAQGLAANSRIRGTLGIKAIPSYNMWVGPRNSYKIEKATVDLAYLYELASQGYYDQEAVDRLAGLGNSGANEEEARAASRAQQGTTSPTNKYIREVDIYHYWGPLYNSEGKLVHPNATFTIAGDFTTVLRGARKNPFFHGCDPYVIGSPYTVPFSIYNRGIVEDIAGIANMITELSNLIIDGAQFDAIPAYEVDDDLLATPTQLRNGISPGMAILTKGFDNQTSRNVVRPATKGQIPQLALQVIAFLDKEGQLASSVINALRGQAVGTETLGEFQSIVGGASESLDDAARTVEETVIDYILERSAKVIYQYHEDFAMPRLRENFPATSLALSDMSSEERYATMMGGFAFRARGVSIFLDKGQDLQKVIRFLEMVANIPGILTRLNVDEMLEQIIIAMGWNPSKILVNPASQPVIPPAVLGGSPISPPGLPGLPGPGAQPGASELTPMQVMAGNAGAREGGSRNNPMANFGFGR